MERGGGGAATARPVDTADAALLVDAVKAAQRVALDFRGRTHRHWTKDNNSPVTEADIAVDHLLRDRLLAARPDYGWLSEETADTPERLERRRLFVVDPIDGTRAFMEGVPNWTICAAVVENGRPVAAAIAWPEKGTIFRAVLGGGAWRDRMAIGCSRRHALEGALLAGPGGLLPGGEGCRRAPWVHSLALRLCLVAEGSIDGAVARAHAADWDLAAADLLVHEAGGAMTGIGGETPRYNRLDTSHGALVAAGNALHARLCQAVAEAVAVRP